MEPDPRYEWQDAGVDQFIHRHPDDFLVVACPAAGKTDMAAKAIQAAIAAGQIRYVIVVVPRTALRSQWHERLASYRHPVRLTEPHGLDVSGEFVNAKGTTAGADGYVTTYQAVAANPDVHRAAASRHRTLVIFDECHHMEDESTWGAAIEHAFEHAARRLSLSGTPFRSNRKSIPFITYDGNGVAVPSNEPTVTYRKAVNLGMCRPIQFDVVRGTAHYRTSGANVSVDLREASDGTRQAALQTVYDPEMTWIRGVITQADAELTLLRETDPRVGGLILAPRQVTARAYAKIVKEITGEMPVVTLSDDPGTPDETIDSFRTGKQRWLIAVAQVAEGIDIRRLAVGVWASFYLTELWVRQVVGRFVRTFDAYDELTARLFIPELPGLVEICKRIEDEARIGLADAVDDERARSRDKPPKTVDIDIIVPVSTSDANVVEALLQGDHFGEDELMVARRYKEEAGVKVTDVDVARLLRVVKVPLGETHHISIPVPDSAPSPDRLRKALRKKVTTEARHKGYVFNIPFKDVFYRLNRSQGVKTLPAASVDQLEAMLEILAAWTDADEFPV